MANEFVVVKKGSRSDQGLRFDLHDLLLLKSSASAIHGISCLGDKTLWHLINESTTTVGIRLAEALVEALPRGSFFDLEARSFSVSLPGNDGQADWEQWLPRVIAVLRQVVGLEKLPVRYDPKNSPVWLVAILQQHYDVTVQS